MSFVGLFGGILYYKYKQDEKFKKSLTLYIILPNLVSFNLIASSSKLILGPYDTKQPWSAGSNILCTPVLKPHPTYARLPYLYKSNKSCYY